MNSVFFSYGFLYLSVLLLWFPGDRYIPYWGFALLLSIMLGLLSHQLEWIALIPIILLALALFYSQIKKNSVFVRVIAAIMVIILSVGLMAHQLPGFHNLKVINHVFISHNAIPYTLYLNFDKTIVGILILGFSKQLISSKKEWVGLIKQIAIKAPLVMIVLIVMAVALGFVKIDPKIPETLFIWTITNLLFVCMAEEAFFRGFIQKNLSLIMKKMKYGDYLALFIAAFLFGLVHYPGGAKYVLLAMVAGLGYGWIYLSTKKIEGSILTHFGLNWIHFLGFTYPALTSM